MQRIVGLLVFQTPEARPVLQISPWIDRRFPESIEDLVARIEAQDHRRFLKTHLPADGLPIYDEIKYVHVARDGRDACISFYNHYAGFAPEMLQALDRVGLKDETIGRAYPRLPADPAVFFHRWLTEGAVPGHEDGLTTVSFFHCEQT
jgi:aryl sulfotransferase